LKRLASVLLLISLLVLGSLGAHAVAGVSEDLLLFSGKIVSVDKYGNVMTDITPEDGRSLWSCGRGRSGSRDRGPRASIAFRYHLRRCRSGNPPHESQRYRRSTWPSNYGNFAETYGVSEGTEVSVYLKEKGAYLSEIEIRHLEKLENREDYESDEAFANFREVTAGNDQAGRPVQSLPPVTWRRSFFICSRTNREIRDQHDTEPVRHPGRVRGEPRTLRLLPCPQREREYYRSRAWE